MQLGLFSVSYAGLWGQAALDPRAFVRRAADLGFDAVMLAGKRPHLSPLDYPPDRVGELKAVLDRHGVACPVVAAYTDFAGMPAAAQSAASVAFQRPYAASSFAWSAPAAAIQTAFARMGHLLPGEASGRCAPRP